ncbi:MAG TPA: ribosome-associated translation inhibitor RaiA [Dongiaceae bacterium]|nr:ribosome-associated translation inhibitor RaiA [Dongiaceae bacterium]
MNLTVKGKNIDVGEALRTHVAQSLDHVIAKYFGNPMEATVTFSKQSHLFSADIAVHIGRGILVHAEESADQAYAAFDQAVDHLTKRMRRYKRRLRDHHRAETQSFRASQYILAPEVEDVEPAVNGSEAPAVIAEMQTEIPTLTVGEAVMRLDLSNLKAMMFLNRAHGGLNMVYRRNDGNIGWVDPRLGAAAGSLASQTRQ